MEQKQDSVGTVPDPGAVGTVPDPGAKPTKKRSWGPIVIGVGVVIVVVEVALRLWGAWL